MKRIFILLAVICSTAANAFEWAPYAAIGIGYKFSEPKSVVYNGRHLDVDFGGKDSALFEVGYEWSKGLSLGLKHDSQYSTGWPFNDRPEYRKTEVFIRYKIGGV